MCVFIKAQIEPRLCNPTAGFKVQGFQPSSSVSVFGLTKKRRTMTHRSKTQRVLNLTVTCGCEFKPFTHYLSKSYQVRGPSGILGLFLLTIASFSPPMVTSQGPVEGYCGEDLEPNGLGTKQQPRVTNERFTKT